MLKVKVTIDESIQAAIRRIIENELGIVPIQITTVDRATYEINIDADPTNEQKLSMRNQIIALLEGLGKYPTFEIIE